MEKAGYVLLAIVAIVYLLLVIGGLIIAFPWGIIGLILIVGLGLLFIRVLRDRLSSKEDDYYSKNVEC